MSKEIEFEKALSRLDEIVKTLEAGKCSLEESMKLFEEGTALSKVCYKKIKQKSDPRHSVCKSRSYIRLFFSSPCPILCKGGASTAGSPSPCTVIPPDWAEAAFAASVRF